VFRSRPKNRWASLALKASSRERLVDERHRRRRPLMRALFD
jgi:hypothetical protein